MVSITPSTGGNSNGSITLTTATAKKGDIGVYLEAIGTVTPVYTTTVYNQVTEYRFSVSP